MIMVIPYIHGRDALFEEEKHWRDHLTHIKGLGDPPLKYGSETKLDLVMRKEG